MSFIFNVQAFDVTTVQLIIVENVKVCLKNDTSSTVFVTIYPEYHYTAHNNQLNINMTFGKNSSKLISE